MPEVSVLGSLPGLRAVRSYRRAWLAPDVVAGVVLSTLLVPQGMAYAELAGLPPITGLYTSILCLLGYAAFGPSRILVLGPDSSLGPMIAATILPLAGADGDPERAVALASMLAVIVAAVMLAGDVAKLGFIADLISKPTMIGYLNGLALTILAGQLPKLFGFKIDAEGLVGEIAGFARGLVHGEAVAAAATAGICGIALILALQHWLPKFPAVLIMVVLEIAATTVFSLGKHGVSLVGVLPKGFPPLTLPGIRLSDIGPLAAGALGIAVVSLADTISTASAFAARTGQEVHGNGEMIGIGAANLAAGLFQGFPVSTSGSRTAVAERSGAKTQLAGVTGAAVIIVMILLVPGLFRNLPQPALAAVVITASLSLADIPGTVRLWRQRKAEFLLSVTAFAGVALLGVLPGIAVAVALSILNVFRRAWWPYDTQLGRVPGLEGYHDIQVAARPGRSAAGLDPGRRRAADRRRHDRLRHARGTGRGAERARHQPGVRGAQGPGAEQDRALRADQDDRPAPLLPDDRIGGRGVPRGNGRRMGRRWPGGPGPRVIRPRLTTSCRGTAAARRAGQGGASPGARAVCRQAAAGNAGTCSQGAGRAARRSGPGRRPRRPAGEGRDRAPCAAAWRRRRGS
jgi:high affinity sulfate transporter 1